MWLFFVISDAERDSLGELIARLARGDNGALAEIYSVAGGRLLSVAAGYVRSRAMAEDVLQDSLVKAVKNSAQFREGSNGYAWLCTIVRNTALNSIKSEGRRRCEDITSFFGLSEGIDNFSRIDNRAAVEYALLSLVQNERLAVWLKYFNEMTVRQIAAELNISKSAAAETIARAEKKMKIILGER